VITPVHGPEGGRRADEALVRRRPRRAVKAGLEGQACNGASSFIAGPPIRSLRRAESVARRELRPLAGNVLWRDYWIVLHKRFVAAVVFSVHPGCRTAVSPDPRTAR